MIVPISEINIYILTRTYKLINAHDRGHIFPPFVILINYVDKAGGGLANLSYPTYYGLSTLLSV